ncbi:hypothetical protein A2Y83_02105 [Candidatus Falkowbacteria bacterium RBG_13_39_14]|uniref:HD/PDEase domain-containing protein n=1 Tax=Candidatus Falkowbacteria bacterium RBG_13_39_14 TaxID=1797985 RepID=A0A1F5S8P1_9BACT|nr:MAG: hypothetical protein A2Y83_02105 [Candidatus Falkowbacteria bacterium RBG_13_39_14]
MGFERVVNLFPYVIAAHSNQPNDQDKAFRRWDNKTPYFIHPIWCAMTVLTEESLSKKQRINGAQAVLLHDILEDTELPLPSDASFEVVVLVQNMTFKSSEEEMEQIWNKGKFVQLLKLYDKVSNLLDSGWMSDEKRMRYCEYVKQLTQVVQKNFGNLNIISIAQGIVNKIYSEVGK